MKTRGQLEHLTRLLTKGPTLLVLALLVAQPSLARPVLALSYGQVNQGGFGDYQNSYAWSMAWWNGKLYVGTNRNFPCVENATLDFYLPVGFYQTHPDPAITCSPDKYDLDLRAEIWQYTPGTFQWKRVFQSPNDLPNPKAPGKFVARDIGFRDMVVFTEPDGTEALYVAGVTAGEYIPGLPPPRILRSTDGEIFTPIPQDPGTFLGTLSVMTKQGNVKAIGFRSMVAYNGRLYLTATPGLTGSGVLLEAANPAGGNNNFRQVSPPTLDVYELAVFSNYLYVGSGDLNNGYSVWKTDATGSPPYTFTSVVANGAGRGAKVLSVVSMRSFQGRLYVGSNGFFPTSLFIFPAELIRINPDDTWELVVGNPRQTSQGLKSPISGLLDGFGNPFNAHFWRMQEHGGMLYLGTNDSSVWFRGISWLDPFINAEYGFDLWATADGTSWSRITRNGFGDKFNFGARTFASTPWGLFLGTVNYVTGTEVWLITP